MPLDVTVETLPQGAFKFHLGTTAGTEWLCSHTTVQEWNGGLVFGVDRTVELCSGMHLDGLEVGE
jgi:hypothetical protein